MYKFRRIIAASAIVGIFFLSGILVFHSNWFCYRYALKNIENKEYYKAFSELKRLGSYQDSQVLLAEISEYMNGDKFGICDRKPAMAAGSILYQMDIDGTVSATAYEDEIKQIVNADTVCLLDVSGNVRFACDWCRYKETVKEVLPLSAGYTAYMIDTVLDANQDLAFEMLGRDISRFGFKILLEDGSIAAMIADDLETITIENESITYLSGDYALTQSGNVYYIEMKSSDDTKKKFIRCVYDKQDIVAIDGDAACLAITRTGDVLYFGKNQWGEGAVDNWKNVISVEISRLFSIGLTKEGTILFASDIFEQELVEDFFKDWTDIKAIAADEFGTVIGIRENGEVLWAYFEADGNFANILPDAAFFLIE